MAYSINKTDGTLLATVADGQIDNLSTDITLIGKNYSGFGESLNENFIKLLENFAGTARPTNPVRGQVWFDTSESKLKVYTGIQFVPVSSASIANFQPAAPGSGDLWFNNIDKQLYFYEGTQFVLLGPAYSLSQGLSGFKVETILDTLNTSRVVTTLYNNGILLGIFSKDSFTPKVTITGFTGSITPGFNAGTLTGLKFNVTASNADKLNNVLAAQYARRDEANNFSEPVIITNNTGVTVGTGTEGSFNVSSGNVRLYNTASNKNLSIAVQKGVVNETAINIISASREVKIYDGFADSLTTLGGNLIVTGNLTVQGDTTTVNTATLTIEDKNVILASLQSGTTDANADGGGMILKGATDHEFIWNQSLTTWDSTESINLANARSYKINGTTVLDANQCTVTSFPNLNQLGTLVDLTVDDIFINNHRISTTNSQDLEIEPDGSAISLIGSPIIKGLSTTADANPVQVTQHTGSITDPALQANPVLSATELSESTNKKYVLNFVRRRSLTFSMDVSDYITDGDIAAILVDLAPVDEFENGTKARILCSRLSNSSVSAPTSLASPGSEEFVRAAGGTAFGITSQTINSPITVPGQTITVFRVIKLFTIISGAWQYQTDIPV
jgi:hypothetical protein